ncbi:MAG: phosphoserine phosphatase SerB, partial [Roseovarius sp.]|nr:phosphoserine phosphatase SerB [Roseovarius sp.]
MHTATLIARPGALEPALVESLRNAWGGGAAEWLSPDEAAEFDLPAMPENLWQVWHDLQARQTDLAVQ